MSKNNNNANKLTSLGYEYDKENDIYFKVNENNRIEYQTATNKLIIEKFESKNLKSIIYYRKSQSIILSHSYKDGEIITQLKYNVPLNKMECYKENCENYRSDINHILKINREISTTLQ